MLCVTCEMRRVKAMSTWFNFRCFSVWKDLEKHGEQVYNIVFDTV